MLPESRGSKLDPAYTPLISAVNHVRRHGITFLPGPALAPSAGKDWVFPNARPCEGQLSQLAMAVVFLSSYPQGIGRNMWGRFYGARFGRDGKRRKERACPVGRKSTAVGALGRKNAAVSSTRAFPVKPRHAGCWQGSWAGVPDDLAW
ncbi:hypothetical protein MPNT_40099 [Candidatus Methylacidithermus pantelleriae]|uniref:Uncharacterized protein n=1 Tax=Candidatus Methylacidithermus pantelleriae TaxID=2744239 RepID=A0A8J2BV06_9BACT|nr:hypothetical protein MPNT_40099 [Candidatus Methylacidithermus pantelleriae]